MENSLFSNSFPESDAGAFIALREKGEPTCWEGIQKGESPLYQQFQRLLLTLI